MVDHLTNWVEAMPPSSATAKGVVKVLLGNIIPQFGLVKIMETTSQPM
jgi:hypothetical protein